MLTKSPKSPHRKGREVEWGTQFCKDSLERIKKTRVSENEVDMRQDAVQRKEPIRGNLRRNLSESKKARDINQAADGAKLDFEVRKIMKMRKNLGTKGGIGAAIEAAKTKATFERQAQAQKQKEREEYWNNLSSPSSPRNEESDRDEVESVQLSDGHETAPRTQPTPTW